MQISASFAYLHFSAFFLTNENLLMFINAMGKQAFEKALLSPSFLLAWREETVKKSEIGKSDACILMFSLI